MSIANYQDYNCDTTVTIASSGTESNAVDLNGTRVVGIITPAALTGTAITLKASFDGTNFHDMYNKDGVQMTITVAASRWVALAPADLAGVRYLKLVSGSAEAAERVISIVTRPLS